MYLNNVSFLLEYIPIANRISEYSGNIYDNRVNKYITRLTFITNNHNSYLFFLDISSMNLMIFINVLTSE